MSERGGGRGGLQGAYPSMKDGVGAGRGGTGRGGACVTCHVAVCNVCTVSGRLVGWGGGRGGARAGGEAARQGALAAWDVTKGGG